MIQILTESLDATLCIFEFLINCVLFSVPTDAKHPTCTQQWNLFVASDKDLINTYCNDILEN
jgi:hypothetical protein